MARIKLGHILGLVVIVGMTIYGGVALKESMTIGYSTFEEAAKSGRTVQVSGKVVEGSRRYNSKDDCIEFEMEDQTGERMLVSYHGVPPAGFEGTSMLVVIGRFEDGCFHAKRILTKCPSRYRERQNAKRSE